MLRRPAVHFVAWVVLALALDLWLCSCLGRPPTTQEQADFRAKWSAGTEVAGAAVSVLAPPLAPAVKPLSDLLEQLAEGFFLGATVGGGTTHVLHRRHARRKAKAAAAHA